MPKSIADCEPSGYVLEISIGAGLPPSAEANYGGSRIIWTTSS